MHPARNSALFLFVNLPPDAEIQFKSYSLKLFPFIKFWKGNRQYGGTGRAGSHKLLVIPPEPPETTSIAEMPPAKWPLL